MTCPSEIIKQIAEYTGEKHAKEWYEAIFAPQNTDKLVEKTLRRIEDEELYHLVKTCSWEREDALKTYNALGEYFAKIMEIPPRYYPEIALKEITDKSNNNTVSASYDNKSFKPISLAIHFDAASGLDNASHIRTSDMAHEMLHVYQHIIGCAWCRKHRWWFQRGWKVRRLHLLFALLRPIKPRPLLYWLNWQIYIEDTSDVYYSKQIIEAEAIDTAMRVQCAVLKAWRKFDKDSTTVPANK